MNYISYSVCQSYGFDIENTEKDKDQQASIQTIPIPLSHGSCSGFPMVDFYVTLFGSSRIMALCNVIGIEVGRLGLAQRPLILPPWQRSSNKTDGPDTETKSENGGQTKVKKAPEKPPQNVHEADPVTKNLESVPMDDSIEPSKSVDKVQAKVQETTDPVQVTKTKSTEKTESTSNEDLGTDAGYTESISTMQPSGSGSDLKIDPTPTGSVTKDSSDKTSSAPAVSNPELKEPPEVVFVPPPAEKLNSEAAAIGANSGGQRESVWQKLSNKIKALERNVSLSGGYLEELSVRYKKQIEDLQLAVRQSGEALAAASKAREHDRHQVKDLKEEIGQLKLLVEEVSTRMETMSTWVSFITSSK